MAKAAQSYARMGSNLNCIRIMMICINEGPRINVVRDLWVQSLT
jgi:hypothetical protein